MPGVNPCSGQAPVWTIGHSTLKPDVFISRLKKYNINLLVDIRTIPRSRHNPQFNSKTLESYLTGRGIGYRHMKNLGGLRKARQDSQNVGFRNLSFRGYADYMQTEEFSKALQELLGLVVDYRTAIMCAEAVPWRCHRSLVSDALVARGICVEHIVGDTQLIRHTMTSFAQVVDGSKIIYQ